MANSRVLVGFSFVGTTLAAVIALFWYWNKRDPDQNRRQKKQKDGDPVWVVDNQVTHPELPSLCTQTTPEDDIIVDDDVVKSEKTSNQLSHGAEAEINQNSLEDDEYAGNICREVDDAGITRNRDFCFMEEIKSVAPEQSGVLDTHDKTVEPELKSPVDAENKTEENSASKEVSAGITVSLDSKDVLKSDSDVVPQGNVAPVMTQVTVIENEMRVSGAEDAESKCEQLVLTMASDSAECCEKSRDSSPVTVAALLISDSVDTVNVPESSPAELEYVISKETSPVETNPSSEETVTDSNGMENSHEAETSSTDVKPILNLQDSVSVDSLETSPEPEVHLRSQYSQSGSDSGQSVTIESSSTESSSKGDYLEHLVREKVGEVTESLNDLNVCNDAESEVSGSDCDKHGKMNSNEREPSRSTESGLSRDSLEPIDTSQQTTVLDETETEEAPDNDSGLLLTPTDPNTNVKHTEVVEKADTPSNNCDNTSEASNDSGKGASVGETIGIPQQPELSIYQMDFPTELCGRLIGRYGKNINYMKEKTGAIVTLRNNPFSPDFQICTIEGLPHEIEETLAMIRQKFPKSRYPNLQLTPNNMAPEPPVVLPDLQMNLPHGVSVDVIVSSIVNAGLVFLQQPTHPTFPSLERLNQFMLACYTQDQSVPQLPRPVEAGVICAAPVMNGWYRALVVDLSEDGEECDIKFVDYGGYSRLPISHLRQIRSDFMTLPFQAVECYMANITPIQGDMYFNSDGATVLEELTQGKLLQAQVVGRAEDGIPFVHIYQVSGNKALFVNREMVNRGVARWIERL